jgi:hypothetical protein
MAPNAPQNSFDATSPLYHSKPGICALWARTTPEKPLSFIVSVATEDTAGFWPYNLQSFLSRGDIENGDLPGINFPYEVKIRTSLRRS